MGVVIPSVKPDLLLLFFCRQFGLIAIAFAISPNTAKIIFYPKFSFFRFKSHAKMAEIEVTQNKRSGYGYFIL
ncbi:hypothetical protein [Nostoc sp. CALU 1950]|uniref:hypothetical protein n=1 Tax=Nostoc sp. CALU 1950 TaxID=3104321 RepID=UPI003EB7489A